MKVVKSKRFVAKEAWGSQLIANMQGITTKLHWTDKPYKWHINDGEEVFVVLSGKVEMLYKESGIEQSQLLSQGDIFYADIGCEHMANPIGSARILVVEKEGSI